MCFTPFIAWAKVYIKIMARVSIRVELRTGGKGAAVQ